MLTRRLLMMCTAATLLGGCDKSEQRLGESANPLPKTSCGHLTAGQVEGKTVVCGWLTVPADWSRPEAGEYALFVTHFFPRGELPRVLGDP